MHKSVAENIFLGLEPLKKGLISKSYMIKESSELMKSFSMDIDPETIVSELSTGMQQTVEIMRAINRKAKIVIMDEPTGGLSAQEVKKLFEIIKTLKEKNISIIYISHRMEEIFKISERITILRDGENTGTFDTESITKEKVIELMAGKKISSIQKNNLIIGETILKLKDLSTIKLKKINFELRKGEILGIAGLLGSGRTEIFECIYGINKNYKGKIYINSEEYINPSINNSIMRGIGFVTEDRKRTGLSLKSSISKNITLPMSKEIFEKGIKKTKKIKTISSEYSQKVGLNTQNMSFISGNLSGGNQQKVLIARWLAKKSKILLLDEPTVGVDVNAKQEIHQLIRKYCSENNSAIVSSSDFPELLDLCNRIIIISDGKIVKELENKNIDEKILLKYATSAGGEKYEKT
jgi:ABC-type sugar transport system ATPase subunit